MLRQGMPSKAARLLEATCQKKWTFAPNSTNLETNACSWQTQVVMALLVRCITWTVPNPFLGNVKLNISKPRGLVLQTPRTFNILVISMYMVGHIMAQPLRCGLPADSGVLIKPKVRAHRAQEDICFVNFLAPSSPCCCQTPSSPSQNSC